MALSQAAAPEGVWLAARGWCAQGRPPVTNWVSPALLCADWAQQLNTRLWEVMMSHPCLFERLVRHPFYQCSFTISINKRHGTPVMNETVWPECHTLVTFFLRFNRYDLLVMASLLVSSSLFTASYKCSKNTRKKEESLSFEGFFSYVFKYFPTFLGSSRVGISH